MKYVYTNTQMKSVDNYAINSIKIPAMVLMEKAAMSLAAVIMERESKNTKILAVCGVGNNGGDGICVARILFHHGYDVNILVVGDDSKMTKETKNQFDIADSMNIPFVNKDFINKDYDVYIDALFGIGLSRDVEGDFEYIINTINKKNKTCYAVDIPSGINGTTGKILNVAIKADVTVTFSQIKQGLLLYPGKEYAGETIVKDIEFPQLCFDEVISKKYYYEKEDLKNLPYRAKNSHKGTFGKVLIVGGCDTMCGACILAAKAAYRIGAGLVKIISSNENRDIILSAIPEAIFATRDDLEDSIEWADAILVGPGLGISPNSNEIVKYIVENAPVPTIIDGDGIRLLSNITKRLSENFILTPHVKEMSYLTGLSILELKDDLVGTTLNASNKYNCIILQKDSVSAASDGNEVYINVSGCEAMAKAGSGDVLAGIILGLLAQNTEPFEATKLGAYIHGLCGEICQKKLGSYSVLATDLTTAIKDVISHIGKKDNNERI